MKKKWLDMYNCAKKYYEEHGNLEVKLRYITEDGIKLGFWIYNQKKAYKNRFIENNNTLIPLTDEQIFMLESIGIMWEYREEHWMEMYMCAKEFYEKNGNLYIPINYVTENKKKLGKWIIAQRISYKNRYIDKEYRKNSYTSLTNKQVELLNSICMIWDLQDVPVSLNWMEKYNNAKKYYEKHGDLKVVQNYIQDGFNLGNWIRNQRRAYKNRVLGKRNNTLPLTDEQVKLLENIGMIWDMEEYVFSTTQIKQTKKIKLEKRFLEFLSNYIKENKNEFESLEDVRNIEKEFVKTLGSRENHYRKNNK